MLVPISKHWNTLPQQVKELLHQSYFIKGHQFHRDYLESIGKIWHDDPLIILGESSVYTKTRSTSLTIIDKLIQSLDYKINPESFKRLGPFIEMYFNSCLMTLLMHHALETQALRNFFRSQSAYDAPNRAIIWFPTTASKETYDKRRNGLCIHNLRKFTEDLHGDEVEELRLDICNQLKLVDPTDEAELWMIILAPFS